MKLSIIIATYQSGKTLEKAFLSIRQWVSCNHEVIVIDGGSTDETMTIVQRNQDLVQYWVSEKDAGIYDAFNKGTKQATGDYVYFLGSDDVLLKGMAQMIGCLIDPNTIYYGDVSFLSSGLTYGGKFNGFKLAIQNICHQAIVYPRAVFNNYNYNTDFPLLADHLLNMVCFKDKQFKFSYHPFLIALYNDKGKSSASFDAKFIEDKMKFVKSCFPQYIYGYALLRKYISKYILKRKYYQV